MTTKSWLQPHLDSVLKKRQSVLAHWRDQQPSLSGKTKNFENWLLVELVHELIATGFAPEVRTNGQFDQVRIRACDVTDLRQRGRKAAAKHLSADLSVRWPSRCFSAEIKTGLAAADLLDDLCIVRHYNKKVITSKAELGWVALLPKEPERHASCEKTRKKILERLKNAAGSDLQVIEPIDITGDRWLFSCVVVPR